MPLGGDTGSDRVGDTRAVPAVVSEEKVLLKELFEDCRRGDCRSWVGVPGVL